MTKKVKKAKKNQNSAAVDLELVTNRALKPLMEAIYEARRNDSEVYEMTGMAIFQLTANLMGYSLTATEQEVKELGGDEVLRMAQAKYDAALNLLEGVVENAVTAGVEHSTGKAGAMYQCSINKVAEPTSKLSC